MNSHIPRHRFLGSVLIGLALALLPGCAAVQSREAVDWGSPRMLEIEKEWRSLEDADNAASRGRSSGGWVRYEEHVRAVDRMFEKRLSNRDLCDLAASPKLPSVPEDQSTFVYAILTHMVKAFVQSGNRQCLVDFLAQRCPGRIHGPGLIEFYIVFHGKTLKDPILVLGESYAKCRVPETRRALAASVRRGFAGRGIPGKDDAEFVNNSMKWYEKEKGHLIVNSAYTLNETSNGRAFTIESYEQHPEYYDNPPQARDPLFVAVHGSGRSRFIVIILAVFAVVVGALFVRSRFRKRTGPTRKAEEGRQGHAMRGEEKPRRKTGTYRFSFSWIDPPRLGVAETWSGSYIDG